MKEHILNLTRDLVSPSVRYEVRKITNWLKEQLSRACLWNWEIARLTRHGDSPYGITFIGRKTQRALVKSLLAVNREIDISPSREYESDRSVFVSEMPFPGAMCVPSYLGSIVPLARSIEEITANYHSQLRRELKKHRPRYRLQQVLDSAEIERVDREMLRPYATARHGIGAAHIGLNEVKRMAQDYGRLDLLLMNEVEVGCQLGHTITRAGKRYWSTNRCGYPAPVYSDPKRLRETNAMNIHLALEWAIQNDFDYYDLGVALGRPGDGLLEWKRRLGGELDTMDHRVYFHVRLPKVGAAKFLWDAPLFAVEGRKLTLHLGLPDEPNDEEVANRYREMGYRGLFKVHLHCAKPPGDHLFETLRSYYAHQKSPPIVEIISST
jgi:hypothetical protein